MAFPKYESYKDSGFEWLGKIPEHWQVQSLNSILINRNEKNEPVKTEDILSLSIASGVTPYSDENRGGNKAKNDLTAYKLAYPGDIVLNSMNVVVGAVGLSKYFGAISPVYYALYLRNKEKNSIYFYNYIFSNSSFQKYLFQYGKGILVKKSDSGKLNTIRMKISIQDLKKVPLPLPPIAEQKRIVEFLDRKTSEIDQAIAQKQRLIELLQEQKAILINQAVTKGPNPNTPMRDSGIEWVGEIPEHWEVRQLSQLLKYGPKNGISPPVTSQPSGVLSFSISAVKNKKVLLDESVLKRVSLPHRERSEYQVKKDDILIVRGNGNIKLVGTCGLVEEIPEEPCVYPDILMCIRPNEEVNRFFLAYVFGSCIVRPQIEMMAKTSTGLYKVNNQDIRSIRILLPPLEEQLGILEYIDELTQETANTESKIQLQIVMLQELRQVTITEAVTGKIKA
jgi:type I restriction enzyme S subunit